jgi:RNA recognition motif-containing protein
LFISPEKGYAFVKYNSREDALSAINALNGTTLAGGVRPLEVRIAQSTRGMENEPLGSSDHQESMRATGDPNPSPRTYGKWTEYFAPDGKAYFYNTETKVTTWDVPEEFKVQPPPPPPQRIPTPLSGAMDKGPTGSNIFVYGLPDEWRENDFADEFSKFGRIISTKIIYDKVTCRSKGYGFISYTNANAAEEAVASMHGITVSNGKKLKVQIKKGEENKSTRPY